jgi:hypothetical protein
MTATVIVLPVVFGRRPATPRKISAAVIYLPVARPLAPGRRRRVRNSNSRPAAEQAAREPTPA